MDLTERSVLRTHHTAIVADLEPRHLLPQLYQDGILTENDLELISEGQTRRQRCQLLLSMLPTRGPQAYGSFTHALSNDGYNHISEILTEALGQSGAGIATNDISAAGELIKGNRSQLTKTRDQDKSNKRSQSDNNRKKRLKRKKAEVKAQDSSDEEQEQFSSTKLNVCENCSGQLRLTEVADPEFEKLLEKHCCLLMDNVEPRDITDYPYQEQLLTEDECERIHGCATRRDRCALLLQTLSTKRPDQKTVDILQQALNKKYSFIAEKFKEVDEFKENATSIGKRGNVVTIEIVPYKEVQATYGRSGGSAENTVDVTQSDSQCKVSSRVMEEADGSSIIVTRNFPKPDDASSGGVKTLNGVRGGVGVPNKSVKGRNNYGVNNSLETKNTKKQVGAGENNSVVLYSNPASFSEPNKLPNRRLAVTFNHMSSLINQGEYDKFENLTFNLGRKYHSDADMKCLLAYLQASRHLYGNNFDAAKENIDSAMEIVPLTTNPKYFTVELYTAKTRMYITQKKLKKLEDALDDVKMVIESDPIGCSGRAAGWLFMNDGRNKTSQMCMLNFNKPSAISAYQQLFLQAKESFTRALTNFEKDGGKDGPFGVGYAVCRLAILLLRCGDNGLTMDAMVPSAEDIRLAGGYIQRLEDSDIPINKILSLHNLLAKGDYQYRKSNMTRALEHAQAALDVAMEINLKEFIEHARNRVLRLSMLSKGAGVQLEEVTDEQEFNRLVMSDNSDG